MNLADREMQILGYLRKGAQNKRIANDLKISDGTVVTAPAAEAAGAQGKFWQMHDTLFANQQQFAMPNLLAYAEAIGLGDPLRAEYG
jgi:FixJ family two-component response regulator